MLLTLKKSYVYGVLLVGLLLLTTLVWSPKAEAASAGPMTMSNGSVIDTKLYGNILEHQLYYFMIGCYANTGSDKVSRDEVARWDFFNFAGNGSANESVRGAQYEKSQVDCNDQEWIKEAFNKLGFDEPFDAFCSFSFTGHTYYGGNYSGPGDKANAGKDKAACLAGKNDTNNDQFRMGQPPLEKTGPMRDYYDKYGELRGYNVEQVLKSKGVAGKGLSKAEEYVRAYRTFINGGCKANLLKEAGPFKSYVVPSGQHQVDIINSDGSITSWFAKLDDAGKKLKLVETRTGKSQDVSCAQLLGMMSSNAFAYGEYVTRNQGSIVPDTASGEQCDTTSNPDCDENATSCAVDGIGWIICPVMTFMGVVTDLMYGAIAGMLVFDASKFNDADLLAAWEGFRNIANVLFVIAFMLIIYAQITGRGGN